MSDLGNKIANVHHRSESINHVHSVTSDQSFRFPNIKGHSRVPSFQNALITNPKTNHSQVLSHHNQSKYISTNPSRELMLDVNMSHEARYKSPINRTLNQTLLINDSKTTLNSNWELNL